MPSVGGTAQSTASPRWWGRRGGHFLDSFAKTMQINLIGDFTVTARPNIMLGYWNKPEITNENSFK